jgi:hypothetical protein
VFCSELILVFFHNVVCILLHCLYCLGSMLMNPVWLLAILSLHQPLYGSCCFYRLWLLTEPFCHCKPPCAILREIWIIFGFIAYCSGSYFFLYYIYFRLNLLLECLPCLVSSCFSSLSLYLNQKRKEKKKALPIYKEHRTTGLCMLPSLFLLFLQIDLL